MPAIGQLISRFLAGTKWQDFERSRLAGDASQRRYDRLLDPGTGETAVLMVAPPDKGEDVRPFIKIARHLTSIGLSAPAILRIDAANGLLLLEDLGDAVFARVIASGAAPEQTLYSAAIDALALLHRQPVPQDTTAYDADRWAGLAGLAYDWYLFGVQGEMRPAAKQAFSRAMQSALQHNTSSTQVLILRDFHAENLIWLPGRVGEKRVGLLDFQDAMSGHRAYDLVSLLEDARRDVSPDLRDQMLDRYIAVTDSDAAKLQAAFATLGAQRNLRIIGVFARLSLHFGKPNYIDLLPRVWRHLLRDLEHPRLAELRDIVLRDLPAPDKTAIGNLKKKCAAFPTL